MSRKKKPTAPTIRCAVYTRKSCEEGLDLEFNSLDAQRESGESTCSDGGRTGQCRERRLLPAASGTIRSFA